MYFFFEKSQVCTLQSAYPTKSLTALCLGLIWLYTISTSTNNGKMIILKKYFFSPDLLHRHSTVTCWRHMAVRWKTWTRQSRPAPRCRSPPGPPGPPGPSTGPTSPPSRRRPRDFGRSGHSYRIQREGRKEKIYSVYINVDFPRDFLQIESYCNKDFGFSGISYEMRLTSWVSSITN